MPIRQKASKQLIELGVVNAGQAVVVNGRLRVHHALSPSRLCDSTFAVSGMSIAGKVPSHFVLAKTK